MKEVELQEFHHCLCSRIKGDNRIKQKSIWCWNDETVHEFSVISWIKEISKKSEYVEKMMSLLLKRVSFNISDYQTGDFCLQAMFVSVWEIFFSVI